MDKCKYIVMDFLSLNCVVFLWVTNILRYLDENDSREFYFVIVVCCYIDREGKGEYFSKDSSICKGIYGLSE